MFGFSNPVFLCTICSHEDKHTDFIPTSNCTSKQCLLPSIAGCTGWKGSISYLYVEFSFNIHLVWRFRAWYEDMGKASCIMVFWGNISWWRWCVLPKQQEGMGEAHHKVFLASLHAPHCYCNWQTCRLLLGSARSTRRCDLKCHTTVQYQGSWAGKAWQGTITRNPVCMQKKGEPPWKCRS